MVEQTAVNRSAEGSSPSPGAFGSLVYRITRQSSELQ